MIHTYTFCGGILLQEKNNVDTAEHLKNLILISDNTVSNICAYCMLFAILNVNFCHCLLSWYRALEYEFVLQVICSQLLHLPFTLFHLKMEADPAPEI
jgi:hypothetical protein